MKEKVGKRTRKVIMAGVGGKGVLLAGMLLAEAGMNHYKNVLWLPSYSTMVRGGPCECTVILSDEEITSPTIFKAEAVIVMEPGQLATFEGRVEKGGRLILEEQGSKGKVIREDIKVNYIPGVKTAVKIGDIRGANLVLLGAYIVLVKPLPSESVEEALERKFWGRWMLFDLNKKAFEEGLKLVR